jgi:hypothetical protein
MSVMLGEYAGGIVNGGCEEGGGMSGVWGVEEGSHY